MSDTLFDITPYKSEVVRNYSPDWIDATSSDPAWDESKLHPDLENFPAEPSGNAQDNSIKAPTITEEKTPELSHAIVEVVEELSAEEEADRQRLGLKVERAFYEAGCSLRELRDRRLYRSSHKNFEEYCRDRFGFSRQNADYFIAGAGVVDNLLGLTKNLCQTLPTKFEQVRHLTCLNPDEQSQVWQAAVVAAGGRVPSGRIVKGIVERLKERSTTAPPIPYQEGDVVMIRGMGNPDLRKFDGRWAIALRINEYTVTLAFDGKEFFVKPQFLEPVEPKYWVEIKAVHERITRLQQYELDLMEGAGLEVLRRRTCFTTKQMMLLERMEQDYGVV